MQPDSYGAFLKIYPLSPCALSVKSSNPAAKYEPLPPGTVLNYKGGQLDCYRQCAAGFYSDGKRVLHS